MSINAAVSDMAMPPPPPPPPPPVPEDGETDDGNPGLLMAAVDLEGAIDAHMPPFMTALQHTMLGVFQKIDYNTTDSMDIGFGMAVSTEEAVLYLGYVDAMSMLFYMLFLKYLGFQQEREIQQIENRNLQVRSRFSRTSCPRQAPTMLTWKVVAHQ